MTALFYTRILKNRAIQTDALKTLFIEMNYLQQLTGKLCFGWKQINYSTFINFIIIFILG